MRPRLMSRKSGVMGRIGFRGPGQGRRDAISPAEAPAVNMKSASGAEGCAPWGRTGTPSRPLSALRVVQQDEEQAHHGKERADADDDARQDRCALEAHAPARRAQALAEA